ncbi:MAG: SseB family protein [Actinomycetota bacterium]|nr:SseB family protein [Actinomycetota bacterium]
MASGRPGPSPEPAPPAPPARPLAEVARGLKRGESTPQQLFDAFLAATVYSPAPPRPGVHVLQVRGERVVPVFTSEAELARFMGRARWFSTTGLDLLGLLPSGVTIGLDMASPHRLQLDPASVRVDQALHLRREEG